VFGTALATQPLMQSVLADMALEVEGAVALVMRLARAFDRAADDPAEAAYARLLTPVVKYWVCKAAPPFVYEAMECLGGNGYVEDGVMAQLYREAPVNAIWEGAGNVMCLDVLRAIAREGEASRAVMRSLAEAKGLPGVAATLSAVAAELAEPEVEAQARSVVGRLAQVAAVAALAGHAPAVAELFARTRLTAPHGFYGSASLDAAQAKFLLDRALP
jgi:putative acyl-CoA dehydrogenase